MSAGPGETVTYTCQCCGLTKDYDRSTFEMLQRSLVAQGLPFHVQDPVVLAQVAARLAHAFKEKARYDALPPKEKQRIAEREAQMEAEKQRARAERQANAVVYYVHRGNRIKIGTTTVGEKRWNTWGGALLTTEPGGRELEHERHERFAAARIGTSEWFQATPQLLAWIATLQRLQLERWRRKEQRP
jgi:hypothetical protein